MILLSQRWVDGIKGGEQFGRQVVEALVILPMNDAPSFNHGLYSLFYDQGQNLSTPFKTWFRGAQGSMAGVASHGLELLSTWAAPPENITSIKEYIANLKACVDQIRAL